MSASEFPAVTSTAVPSWAAFRSTWVDLPARTSGHGSPGPGVVDDDYTHSRAVEARRLSMLAELWHAPAGDRAVGTSTAGYQDARLLAGLAAKLRWQARCAAQRRPASCPNLVCGPASRRWGRFARHLDVELRPVPLTTGPALRDPTAGGLHCDANTIAVVVTGGVTGLHDDVAAVSAALDTLERETGIDVDIHVDAGCGGVVTPFLAPDLRWDFRLPRVRSISASSHATGWSSGRAWTVWRDAAALP